MSYIFEIVFWVIPSFALRETVEKLKRFVEKIPYHISGIKGIDFETEKTPLMILKEELSEKCKIFVLGGPSFAKEVAFGLPTAVVIAGENPDETRVLQELLALPYFRVYSSDDPVGVEIAGGL